MIANKINNKILSVFLTLIIIIGFTLSSKNIIIASAMTNGIDISHNNGSVDFSKLKNNVNFVYIKATENTTYTDVMLKRNILNAKTVGLNFGLYHFLRLYSAESCKNQADYFWNTIKNTGYNLVPVVDVEVYDGETTSTEVRTCIRAFVDEFYKDSGTNCVIYTYKSYMEENLLDKYFSNYILWQAQYSSAPTIFSNWGLSIWQKSESGRVSGISGNVDLDIAYNNNLYLSTQSKSNSTNISSWGNGLQLISNNNIGVPYNANVKTKLFTYDKNGKKSNTHYIDSGESIRIINITSNNLLEIEYSYSGATNYSIHGYLPINNLSVINLWYSNNWITYKNITVYDMNGKNIGTIFSNTICDYYYSLPCKDKIIGRYNSKGIYCFYRVKN